MAAGILQTFAFSALAVWLAMTGVWFVSLARRDASIVDAFWGPGFALVAVVALALDPPATPYRLLLVGMTVAWAARLGVHLLRRNLAHGEDGRYREMRRKAGAGWALRSYVTVFLLQGALMWLISLPLQVAIVQGGAVRAGAPLVIGGAGLFLFGFLFEAMADRQLARFKADTANAGKVLDTGLWRYSRHPNYFGEACVWWGLFLAALPAPGAAWTAFSPAVVTFLLLKVSGVPLTERHVAEGRPAYRDYIRRTSAFIPWPPR
ncbi:MAG: DUF1295 domain-containing protein [Alphaproteobacteria bacterium]|nr:DUF1295 domain-containing protein [Alphaproteobacteria bacterium]